MMPSDDTVFELLLLEQHAAEARSLFPDSDIDACLARDILYDLHTTEASTVREIRESLPLEELEPWFAHRTLQTVEMVRNYFGNKKSGVDRG